MSHADKVEVMDFVINVLKDHEKCLDTLITRAEGIIEEKKAPRNLFQNPPSLKIKLTEWEEFCDKAVEAELVCFDLEETTFYCNAITENKIYRYSEEVPEIIRKLKKDKNNSRSHIDISNNPSNSNEKPKRLFELDNFYTKNWLSRELGIHRDFIVRGNVEN